MLKNWKLVNLIKKSLKNKYNIKNLGKIKISDYKLINYKESLN